MHVVQDVGLDLKKCSLASICRRYLSPFVILIPYMFLPRRLDATLVQRPAGGMRGEDTSEEREGPIRPR